MSNRLLLFALMAALLVGLAGQGIARAAVPSSVGSGAPAMTSDECMAMMAQAPIDEDKRDCSPADCLAAMLASGSVIALTPQFDATMPMPGATGVISVSPVRTLFGRSLPPDLRPPNSI